MMLDAATIERFWSKVSVGGAQDCWPWTGHQHVRGYGIFWLDGKNVRANRVALMLSELPPFEDALALHGCDNPVCCNPEHLRWGTAQDNVDDRLLRKGDMKGENSPKAVATEAVVSDIYRRRIGGETCREISIALGLNYDLVMNIYTGKSWAHRLGVDGNPTLEQLRSSKPKNRRKAHNRVLSDAMVDRIFQGRMEGLSAAQLATELGLPKGTVSPVHSGLAFTERLGLYGNPTLGELRSVQSVNPSQKIFDDDIVEIVALLKAGYTGRSIAEKFGTHPSKVSAIKKAHGL